MNLKTFTLAGFFFILNLSLSAQQRDTRGIIGNEVFQNQFQFIPYTGPTGPPEPVQPKAQDLKRLASRSGAQLLDSIIVEGLVPAGATYAIKLGNLDNTFSILSPIPDLTPAAQAALHASPAWLRDDLHDNLRKLDSTRQNEYAQAILQADTLYRDEVAFQVAHLSPNMTLPTLNRNLPLVNAQGIYQIAPDLKYVKLVEHGSAASGDWHTTTSYRIVNAAGDTVWSEIPRDIYYWWVLMPIVYEEQPKMDSTAKNEFWRTYVYNNADSGYPVLKNVLKDATIFWDGQNYHWDNRDGSTPRPFGDSLSAVQVLGRWVAQTITEDALAPRPSQPNVTLHDHNGNCGEIEQLQTSGGRAALFPLMPVSTLPGDHIWNEIFWPDSGKWAFYQIARVGGPTDINWTQQWLQSGCITAMRADGYRWMVNENYNPVCTVTVVVRDMNGRPVDGAQVTFLAPPSFDRHSFSQVNIGNWGHTDENGILTVQLGTDINYFIRADWQNGHYPTSPTLFYTLPYTAISPGSHRWVYLDNGVHTAVEAEHNLVTVPQPDEESLVVEYEVPYHVTYGGGFWDYPHWQDDFLYARKTEGGSITSFICNDLNHYRYYNDTEFDAYTYQDSVTTGLMTLDLKPQEDYYIGFSNKSKLNIAEVARVKVYLYENESTAVSELNSETGLNVSPNPSNGLFNIEQRVASDEGANLEILNPLGAVVYHSQFNRGETRKAINLSSLAKGMYLLRVYNNETTEVRKLVLQ